MLKDLFALQNAEAEERAVEAARKASPAYRQMKESKAAFAEKKARYLQMAEQLASLKEQLAAFPTQLKEIQDKLAEEQKAIYDGSVGNVKILAARQAQAASLEDKLQDVQALNALYVGEKEQKEQALEQLKAAMSQDHEAFLAAKAQYQQLQEEGEQKLAVLAKRKKELLAIIDSAELAWYDSVKHKCNGTPIARLGEDQVCGGCFTMVTPVAYHRTGRGQRIYCEKCGRLLFVDNDGGEEKQG